MPALTCPRRGMDKRDFTCYNFKLTRETVEGDNWGETRPF